MLSDPPLVVFAPSPLLTVTVEAAGTQREEIHLHAGGQGFWVARMAALLGARVSLCCALGGEPGEVLRRLIAKEHVQLLAVQCASSNGVYIHARRDGVREQLARTQCERLSRHETDELFGAALTAALDGRIAMLTGVDPPGVIASDVYQRLARDLCSNGVPVVADLSGAPLRAALEGGIDLLKISDEELSQFGVSQRAEQSELLAVLDQLHGAGANVVLLSRAERPALVLDGAGRRYLSVAGPRFEPLEAHGTGDSMFAALGVGLAAGYELDSALRLAVAAGCLNATRHGLGTGTRRQIEQLSRHVEIEQITAPAGRRHTSTRPRSSA
jgi:1-phosphofructokinase